MVETLLPLAIGLPLIGAVSLGLGGLFIPALREARQFLGGLATALVAVSFGIFFWTFLTYEKPLYVVSWDWFSIAGQPIPFRFGIEPLTLWMSLIITGIGALIHLYSVGYMGGEAGAWRYFAYLNLFIFAMLVLVLGDSLPLVFLGWEGVGLCSYLLIGFWYADMANAQAAQKAFIMNRLGDLAFIAGAVWLYRETGTLDIDRLGGYMYSEEVAMGVGLLFFLAATGKSAQIPLYTWLPDAMAGPTPVSALIHAATMVTAGVFLMARLDFLLNAAPNALLIIGGIGAATALLAALIAIAQNDIKKVLAYSTVSQLGFMFAAVGAGAYITAIFHVFTHAFFKALLFLGSGSVIHATHTQDIRQMGGLRRFMPITGWTFWVGTLAIAGLPPLAGFFSKDEILASLYARGAAGEAIYYLYWGVLLGVAFLTAFYMGRLAWLTFEGEYRGSGHPHESPAVMTLPLIVLGVGSVIAGFVSVPPLVGASWLREKWLGRSVTELPLEPLSHGAEVGLILASVLVAVAGLFLSWRLYGRKGLAAEAALQEGLSRLYELMADAFRVDKLYDKTIVRSYEILADAAKDLAGQLTGRFLPSAIGMGIEKAVMALQRLQVGYVPAYIAYLVAGGLLLLLIWLNWA
jgi:NADH-quinone oxidoreductase subunit L